MPQTIAVASGKGGVGKTFLACTVGQALREGGLGVLLVDADLGLANVDIQLGIDPPLDLFAVLRRGVPLAEAVLHHAPTGLDIVAGRSGSGSLAALEPSRLERLLVELRLISASYDFVLLDLPAGIDSACRSFAAAAGTTLVVTTEEPTALTDAYAFIKVACRPDRPVGIVVNFAKSESQGRQTYETLARACERFLGRRPFLAGIVRRDPRVAEAIRAQKPFLSRYPQSTAAADLRTLARALSGLATMEPRATPKAAI
ncbi:Flagellum site-determining protein YlxH [bacterium HR40]|nr:Flagellum site-determining protein YlxH [bacterium HR40]